MQPVFDAALARWSELGSAFGAVQVVVTDLPGAMLGQAVGQTIYLDRDAAGHGWFVDPTPAVDEEFAAASGRNELTAIHPAAVDRIDLLTVVEHELGHIAGLDDLDATLDSPDERQSFFTRDWSALLAQPNSTPCSQSARRDDVYERTGWWCLSLRHQVVLGGLKRCRVHRPPSTAQP